MPKPKLTTKTGEPRRPSKPLTAGEQQYIRENCLTMADKAIAKKLNRDFRTVRNFRKSLGIMKGHKGKLTTYGDNENYTEKVINQQLTDRQRSEFFRTELTNSLFYTNLKRQFTEEEMDYYMEEWGAMCLQFEDIVATEKRQIDEFIKTEILGNRILRNVRIAEDYIVEMQDEVAKFRKSHDMDDEEYQERDDIMLQVVRSLHSQSQAMSGDYKTNIDLKQKLLNELNARRRDRVDQITKSGTTFMGLIESLRNREERARQDRDLALMTMAQNKKQKEWRDPIRFEDGSKDCILLDDQSNLPNPTIVEVGGHSKLIERFSDTKEKILVIEDELRRKQFFSHVLPTCEIDFCSTASEALRYLNEEQYVLVCFDYDIGLNEKSHPVARKMIDNPRISKDTTVLIHSMNKEGGEKLFSILSDEFETELCPFEELRVFFEDSIEGEVTDEED